MLALKSLIFSLSLLLVNFLSAQELITWYTWEEGMVKAEDTSKKFIVDLYTDWCGWCKKMDKATFQNPEIAEYINQNYIAIKFDAEQKEELQYKGDTHKFKKGGRRGYHTLAAELTGGRLSYPTVVFMDESKNVIQAIPGFLDPQKFNPIMRYFADDLHKTTPWASYLREFQKAMETRPKDPNTRLAGQKKGN